MYIYLSLIMFAVAAAYTALLKSPLAPGGSLVARLAMAVFYAMAAVGTAMLFAYPAAPLFAMSGALILPSLVMGLGLAVTEVILGADRAEVWFLVQVLGFFLVVTSLVSIAATAVLLWVGMPGFMAVAGVMVFAVIGGTVFAVRPLAKQ